MNDPINAGLLQVTTQTLQDWHMYHRCGGCSSREWHKESIEKATDRSPPLFSSLTKQKMWCPLLAIAFPKFKFFSPAYVLTHCHLHISWCVTLFCCGSCVCFTPVPLLVQTALAQKATKLHVLSLGSIFHPCVESRPECCNSCSAISAYKTLCPTSMLSMHIHAQRSVPINKGLFFCMM